MRMTTGEDFVKKTYVKPAIEQARRSFGRGGKASGSAPVLRRVTSG